MINKTYINIGNHGQKFELWLKKPYFWRFSFSDLILFELTSSWELWCDVFLSALEILNFPWPCVTNSFEVVKASFEVVLEAAEVCCIKEDEVWCIIVEFWLILLWAVVIFFVDVDDVIAFRLLCWLLQGITYCYISLTLFFMTFQRMKNAHL